MPTPVHTFARIAAEHGDIDPEDIESIQQWYREILPTLSSEELESVLEKLLERDGAGDEAAFSLNPVYPREAKLPKLEETRRVPLPFLAEGVTALLRRLIRLKPPAD